MMTGARIGWRCILVLAGIPIGARVVFDDFGCVMITSLS
jgi:hypothetical protein